MQTRLSGKPFIPMVCWGLVLYSAISCVGSVQKVEVRSLTPGKSLDPETTPVSTPSSHTASFSTKIGFTTTSYEMSESDETLTVSIYRQVNQDALLAAPLEVTLSTVLEM